MRTESERRNQWVTLQKINHWKESPSKQGGEAGHWEEVVVVEEVVAVAEG